MTHNVATPGVKSFRKLALPFALSLVCVSLSVQATGTAGWKEVQRSAVADAQAAVRNLDHSTSVDALASASRQATSLGDSETVAVTVALNLRNETALDNYLAAISNPRSLLYGQFLSSDQFVQQFSPTQAQVDAVVAYLQQAGFQNIEVAPNRLLVNATGPHAAVQSAFRTHLVRFNLNGRKVFANDAAVSVPSELGTVVKSVLGLDNLAQIHTYHHILTPDSRAPIQPNAVSGSATSHNPKEFPAIYNVGSTPTASNTSVGIISWGSDAQSLTDLKTYAGNNGFTVSASVVKTGASGSTYLDDSSNGDVEWDLDSQTILGVSGGVKQILFYTAPYDGLTHPTIADLTNAYNGAVTANVAKVINVSLGIDEGSTTGQAADDAVFKQAVAQGQTFSVASGDAGVYQWSTDTLGYGPGYVANSRGTVKINLAHYSVSEPATSPYVIAVGGTTLYTNNGAYGGETAWNEGLAALTDRNERLWATGGGVSANETAPTWQVSALGSSITHRVLPDLGFDAASASGANITYAGATYTVGGTSLASPIFVGIWARVQSGLNNALGFPASSIYSYVPGNASLVNDVTSGNNGYGGYGYNAGSGWDYTTGFGSLNIANFYNFVQSTSNFAR
jgi:xanthomonalisin